jgi:tetratricopeptide (TPR) repeat protein
MKQLNLTIITILALLISLQGFAQPDRLSEKEVELQQLLIDASKEKMLGNYEAAITLLTQVLKQDEQNGVAAFELARIYEATGDMQRAIEYAERSTDADPENIWYHRFLADLYQNANQNTKAAAVFEHIIELEPNVDFNYYRWAFFLVKSGAIKKAIKVYDQLEERSGINEEIIRRKHALFLGTGDFKKAAAELERLTTAFPNDIDYRYLLADFYEQINQAEKAKKVYADILKIDPDNGRAKLALSGAPKETTDDEKYLASLQPAFERADVNIDLKIGKILPLIQKAADTEDERLALAVLQLTKILEEKHPTEAKAYAASADLLYYAGRWEEALAKYKKALELDDTVFLLWEQSMLIYYQTKDYLTLRSFSEEALDFFPNQAIAYYYYGVASNQLGYSNEAIPLLQQAVLMSGKNPDLNNAIKRQLALAFNETENYAASDKILAELADASPSGENQAIYALCLARRNQQLDKAQAYAADAAKTLNEHPNLTEVVALIDYQQKRYDEALSKMQLLDGQPYGHSPRTLELYGDILLALGQAQGALSKWKEAQNRGRSAKKLMKKIAAHSN